MIGILGANGFIGRSLADHLAKIDSPYSAFMRGKSFQNPPRLLGNPQIAECNIGTAGDFPDFAGIETLVLSTSATRPNTPNNSIENELRQNVEPYVRFLTHLLTTDVKHVIFLSSGGTIYGDIDQLAPITEDAPRKPCSPYGYGKLCIEAALENIWIGDGRKFTIIRAANPVGSHQLGSIGAHGLVTTTFHKIINEHEITVFGDGSTVRDYFSVMDLSKLIAMISRETSVGSAIINASSGVGMSINDVIAGTAEVLMKTPKVTYDLNRQPRIRNNVLSNNRAFDLFGWRPSVSFPQIIANLADN